MFAHKAALGPRWVFFRCLRGTFSQSGPPQLLGVALGCFSLGICWLDCHRFPVPTPSARSPSLLSPVGTTPRTTLFLPSKLSNLFRRLWPLLIQLGHFAGRTHSPDEAFPQYKAIFHCWGCQLGAVFATQCPTQWFIPKM